MANALQEQGINVANSIADLEQFLLQPELTPIAASPLDYYKQASLMLNELVKNLDIAPTVTAAYA